jgi:hypothetical protein
LGVGAGWGGLGFGLWALWAGADVYYALHGGNIDQNFRVQYFP